MKRRVFIKSLLMMPLFCKVGSSFAKVENNLTTASANRFVWNGDPAIGVDNRESLQSAIDLLSSRYKRTGAIQELLIPDGVYELSAIDFFHSESKEKYGKCCIILKSGLHLLGNGTLKLMDMQYNKNDFFRMISSQRQSERLTDILIDGIIFDGNSKHNNESKQASNILLECESNISITNVKSFNANGMGIMVRGDKNDAAKNIEIKDCTISNCNNIGIQVTHFSKLDISNNKISNCGDNGIDIYGDNGDGKALPTGSDFSIHDNDITNCLTGIFPETVANGNIFDNKINNSIGSGIQVNRIHNEPKNIKIYNNVISGGLYSIRFTGDMNNIKAYGNEFRSAKKSSIMFGNDSNSNTSSITVENNVITTLNNDVDIVFLGGGTMSNITIKGNAVSSQTPLNKQRYVNNTAKKTWRLDVGNWVDSNDK